MTNPRNLIILSSVYVGDSNPRNQRQSKRAEGHCSAVSAILFTPAWTNPRILTGKHSLHIKHIWFQFHSSYSFSVRPVEDSGSVLPYPLINQFRNEAGTKSSNPNTSAVTRAPEDSLGIVRFLFKRVQTSTLSITMAQHA